MKTLIRNRWRRVRPTAVIAAVACSAALATAPAQAQVIVQETAPGGALALAWAPGFGLPLAFSGLAMDASHPAYGNPSGDHTAAVLVNSEMTMGGLGMALTDPMGVGDYTWEGAVFTGDGTTRRGLMVRANPANGFSTGYLFVLDPGLLQLKFRKLSGQGSVELGAWFTTSTPGGFPAVNTWHHMKVEAVGGSFRLWWDGYELTGGTPIADLDFLEGWVGCYNFRFDLGGVPVLFDDLTLSGQAVGEEAMSWGAVKSLYRGN